MCDVGEPLETTSPCVPPMEWGRLMDQRQMTITSGVRSATWSSPTRENDRYFPLMISYCGISRHLLSPPFTIPTVSVNRPQASGTEVGTGRSSRSTVSPSIARSQTIPHSRYNIRLGIPTTNKRMFVSSCYPLSYPRKETKRHHLRCAYRATRERANTSSINGDICLSGVVTVALGRSCPHGLHKIPKKT